MLIHGGQWHGLLNHPLPTSLELQMLEYCICYPTMVTCMSNCLCVHVPVSSIGVYLVAKCPNGSSCYLVWVLPQGLSAIYWIGASLPTDRQKSNPSEK